MELGLATFVDLPPGVTPRRRMHELLEEAELADQLGLDVFAVGEHHRPDFVVSSPAVALAAIAARTSRVRLSSAVTVLSSEDPVRVFQQFAELDLLSDGRAEIMAGRGSFIESFPLFGYDLDDYDELFAEKLDLLLAIRAAERVTWSGRHRPPLVDAGVWPRPLQDPLPLWIAVGGTPASVVRAGRLGLPLTIAIIGGRFEGFTPLVELYRRAGAQAGHDPRTLRVAINTHAFVAASTAEADAAFAAPYLAMMNRIGRERGWPPSGRPEYEALRSPRGALAAGEPGAVAEKILFAHELFGHDRYVGQMSVGAVEHRDVMRSIERFGTEVAPVVREEVAAARGARARICPPMPAQLHFTESDAANRLIAEDPMALLVGFALDQQVTVQQAFAGPLVLRERLGTLEPAALAGADLEPVFRERPAIHRFPGSMAGRVHALASHIRDEYGGDAAAVWRDAADGADLRRRLAALPGFGEMKVKALGAVLYKRFGVSAAESLVPPHPTLGDVDSGQALEDYQAAKRAHKQEWARQRR